VEAGADHGESEGARVEHVTRSEVESAISRSCFDYRVEGPHALALQLPDEITIIELCTGSYDWIQEIAYAPELLNP